MRADRRTLLKGSALIAAAPLAGGAALRAVPTLVVFDSRIAESADFAAARAGHRLDLARAHATRWAALRGELPQVRAIEGLTGWSDWIAVRGELQARGLRLTAEHRVAAPLSGKANLFRWTMTAR